MLCSFTTRFRKFIWFLIFTFTLYCMPNLDLLFPYEFRLAFSEAQAAEETPLNEDQTGEAQVPDTQNAGAKEKTAEEPSASVSNLGGSEGGSLGFNASFPENFVFTGAAAQKIPIAVPPGRAGVAPNLSLTYNSYQQNGWVGLGWSLGMGAIQRSTKRGVNYGANDYVAMMNGASSELLPRTDWGTNYYGNKIEGVFLKYYLNPSTGGWEVTARNRIWKLK